MEAPDIQLFNAVFSLSLGLGYSTYDYKPAEGTAYPFVHVDEVNDEDVINNKDVITGRLIQTIHVWGLAKDRAAFSKMTFNLKQKLRQLNHLDNYYLKYEGMTANSLIDTTTNDTLLHGVIEAEYKLS